MNKPILDKTEGKGVGVIWFGQQRLGSGGAAEQKL